MQSLRAQMTNTNILTGGFPQTSLKPTADHTADAIKQLEYTVLLAKQNSIFRLERHSEAPSVFHKQINISLQKHGRLEYSQLAGLSPHHTFHYFIFF